MEIFQIYNRIMRVCIGNIGVTFFHFQQFYIRFLFIVIYVKLRERSKSGIQNKIVYRKLAFEKSIF